MRYMGSRRLTSGLMVACGFVLAATLGGAGPGAAQTRSEHVHQWLFRVSGPAGESWRVLVTFPRRNDGLEHAPGERMPLVVALHGRGESLKGPLRGMLGWNVDYLLPEAFGALARGRLGNPDFRGLVTARHLAAVNASLTRQPFRGIAVVTPYVPDLSGPVRVAGYADWLAGPLLEQVRHELPWLATGREATGVDGVSLGGMVALEAGFRHPEVFGSVGAMQPAIRDSENRLARLAEDARREGRRQRIRLLSSVGDPYLGYARNLSWLLRRARVPHTLLVVPGPHDYAFNRGPGAIELLRFHDEVLARERM